MTARRRNRHTSFHTRHPAKHPAPHTRADVRLISVSLSWLRTHLSLLPPSRLPRLIYQRLVHLLGHLKRCVLVVPIITLSGTSVLSELLVLLLTANCTLARMHVQEQALTSRISTWAPMFKASLQTQVSTLVSMGFDDAQAHRALFECHFDVDAAISYLLEAQVVAEDHAAGSSLLSPVPLHTQSVDHHRPSSPRASTQMGAASARSNAAGKAAAEDRGETRRPLRGPSTSALFATAHGEGAKMRYSNLLKPDSDSE